MEKERIVDKIKKLLAIANCGGASEAEIINAMSHANSLMEDFQLSEDDINKEKDPYKEVDEAEYTSGRVNLSGKIFQWESSLATYITEFTGVKCYIDNNKVAGFGVAPGKGIVFYGISEEVELAKELYTELRSIISTMAYGLYFSIYKGNGGLYAQGFVNGLYSKLNTKKLETSSTALSVRRNDLIRYKQDKSEKWLVKTTGIKLRKGQGSSGAKGDASAYATGVSHGKSQNVNVNRVKKLN